MAQKRIMGFDKLPGYGMALGILPTEPDITEHFARGGVRRCRVAIGWKTEIQV
jgi:hypothetical protein